MLDYLAVILTVAAVIIFGTVYARLRIFTAVTLGVLVGTLMSGYMAQITGAGGEYDAPRLEERWLLFSFFTFLACIIIPLYIFISAYRESRR